MSELEHTAELDDQPQRRPYDQQTSDLNGQRRTNLTLLSNITTEREELLRRLINARERFQAETAAAGEVERRLEEARTVARMQEAHLERLAGELAAAPAQMDALQREYADSAKDAPTDAQAAR